MKARITFLLLVGLTTIGSVSAALSDALQNKGAEKIQLDAGRRGNVSFPHHRHQETLEDCNICHSVFPQKLGIIEAMKAEGKLEKKYVMNKLCTQCHRQKKKAGEKSGPTTCSRCHMK